jgi:SHS2 domain-containing protein
LARYRLIEHTADIGLTARGDTLAEAFANAAYGMFAIMAGLRNVRETDSRTVEFKDTSPEMLLITWLNWLLYVVDVEHFLFRRFEVTLTGDNGLKAVCYGEHYDPSRHKFKRGIKAATYYLLRVDRNKNSVRIIFDI